MIKVYHSDNFNSFVFNKAEWIKSNFVAVASVDTDDLETAYQLTNHIDTDWKLNKGVVAFRNRNRSTSMGDILVKNNEYFVVDMCGFTLLDENTVNQIKG